MVEKKKINILSVASSFGTLAVRRNALDLLWLSGGRRVMF